jgi:hypothetical protein
MALRFAWKMVDSGAKADTYLLTPYGIYTEQMGRFLRAFVKNALPFTLNRILLGCALTITPPIALSLVDRTFHPNRGVLYATGAVYLILFALYFISKAIQTRREIQAEDRAEKRKIRDLAVVQATYFWKFQEEALNLVFKLERVSHLWHNAGDALVYPLDINLPKILNNTTDEIQRELRDFKIAYGEHLLRLGDFPSFQSDALIGNYPSNREYIVVLYDLREHAATLGRTAQSLFDSGIPLEEQSK